MGFIDFTNGEVLTADQMDLVMRQGIMRFADASARDTALSAVLAEGMMAYLDDTNEVLKYDGTDWIDISGDITGVTAGTALTGGGSSGNVTINADISALSTAQAGNALNANGELLDVDESALTIAQSQVTDLTTDLAGKQDDVITTQGDLVTGDVSGDASRLAIGTADQILTSNGTSLTWSDPSGGGLGDFTQILAPTSLSGSSYTATSLSGYDEYIIELNNVSNDNNGATFSITQLNGVAPEAVNLEVANNSGQSTRTEILSVMQLGQNNGSNGLTDAFVFIESAGGTGIAKLSSVGGPFDDAGDNDNSYVCKGIATKNSLALDEITIAGDFGNFDGGTIQILAR